MAEPTQYHSSEKVNTVRRPYRSGRKPRPKVPTKRPAKVAAIKPPIPLSPKKVAVVVASIPLLAMPGAM